MAAGTAWTSKEIATLKKLWGKKTTREIAQAVGRTSDAVLKYGKKIGLGETKLPAHFKNGRPVNKTKKVAPQKKIAITVTKHKADDPVAKEANAKAATLKGIALDKAMAKIVTPEATLADALVDMQDAVGTLFEALKNMPLTKVRAALTLMAHNLLEQIERAAGDLK